MKRVNVIIAILYSISMFSQNKTIVPKSGTIVFTKETIITDSIALKKSLKVFKPKFLNELKNQIVYERLMNGKKTDSMQLESSMKMIEENFEPFIETIFTKNEKIKIVHDYFGDKIYNYELQNEKQINIIFYDVKSGIIYNDFNKKEIEDYYDEDYIEIKEYRNERKTIQGYNCFKVVYTYNESIDFSTLFKYKKELWVTENIKSPFISMIKNAEILINYYPLEITEYVDGIEGFKTIYRLEVLNLK